MKRNFKNYFLIYKIEEISTAQLNSILIREERKLHILRELYYQFKQFNLKTIIYIIRSENKVMELINAVLKELNGRRHDERERWEKERERREKRKVNRYKAYIALFLFMVTYWKFILHPRWIDTSRRPKKGDPPYEAPIEALNKVLYYIMLLYLTFQETPF
jgi:hypothetical protein